MKSNGFDAAARQLIVGLPLFMGVIEYILRVALKQLNIALTTLTGEVRRRAAQGQTTRRHGQAILIANMGIFASLVGVLLWIYLLVASFSQEVQEILPLHPLRDSSAYYVFSVLLNEWKARVKRW